MKRLFAILLTLTICCWGSQLQAGSCSIPSDGCKTDACSACKAAPGEGVMDLQSIRSEIWSLLKKQPLSPEDKQRLYSLRDQLEAARGTPGTARTATKASCGVAEHGKTDPCKDAACQGSAKPWEPVSSFQAKCRDTKACSECTDGIICPSGTDPKVCADLVKSRKCPDCRDKTACGDCKDRKTCRVCKDRKTCGDCKDEKACADWLKANKFPGCKDKKACAEWLKTHKFSDCKDKNACPKWKAAHKGKKCRTGHHGKKCCPDTAKNCCAGKDPKLCGAKNCASCSPAQAKGFCCGEKGGHKCPEKGNKAACPFTKSPVSGSCH